MLRVLVAVVGLCVMAGCTDPVTAERVLSEQGYTDIQITGYRFFGCSEDDFYVTGFNATSPVGKRVEGCVCQGFLFKNATIRFQ